MTQEDNAKIQVGQALRARRLDLGLSQEELARTAKTSERSIGSAERGESAIQLRKRAAWEEALQLRRGTISRAYRTGSDLETIDEPATGGPESWHRIEWDLYSEAQREGLEEDQARERVQIFRTHVMGWPMRRDWTPPDAQERQRLA